MTPTLASLLGFALWTILLTIVIGGTRLRVAMATGKPPNSFAPGGEDVGGFLARLCRAHANCCENLPVVAAILLAAVLAGHGGVADPLAPWILAARMLQSSVHLASTNIPAVYARFGFYLVQVVLLVAIAIQALMAG